MELTGTGALHMLPLLGVALYLSVYRLLFWLGSRDEPLHLWIGSLGLGATFFIAGRFLQHVSWTDPVAALGAAIQVSGGVVVLVASLGAIEVAAERNPFNRSFALAAASGAVAIGMLLGTDLFFTVPSEVRTDVFGNEWRQPGSGPLRPLIFTYMAVFCVYATIRARRATIIPDERRRITARWVGLFLIPFFVNDLLDGAKVIHTVQALEWGLTAALIMLEHSLTMRFNRLAQLGQALERSQSSLTSLLDGLPDAVFVRQDDVVVFANEPARARFGPAFEVPTSLEPTSLVGADGKKYRVETVEVAAQFDDRPATIVVVRDLTQRFELERKLRLADRLASIGTLATGVAHEINNPLTYSIGSHAELLDRVQAMPAGSERDLMLELLSEIADANDRIRRVVHDITAFSHADGDAIELVPLERVLGGAVRLTRNQLRHIAAIRIDVPEDHHVRANPARLGQVFVSLLVNAAQAIEASDQTGHLIHVQSRQQGDELVITVRDTGVGVAPEHAARAFDPYFTTRPVGEGTGLGLSIAHGIVTGLGGRIELAPHEERGTVATVVLPAVELEPVAIPAPVSRPTGGVLIIDDEPLIGRAIQRMLRKHDVTVCTDAREGLRSLREVQQQVVLCDLMMPGMTGMDFYDAVKTEFPGREEDIIFMTGGAFTERSRQFLDRVDNALLDKPVRPDALREAVAGALSTSDRSPARP